MGPGPPGREAEKEGGIPGADWADLRTGCGGEIWALRRSAAAPSTREGAPECALAVRFFIC